MNRCSTGCLAVLVMLSIVGCGSAGESGGTFDNTGGAPPPGDSIGFRSVSFSLDSLCTGQLGSTRIAVLARAAADIQVINGNESCAASLRTALADAFVALTADQAVGIFTLNLGGCVRSYEVARVTRDGLVIRPWILLHDATLGASGPVGCTADLLPVVRVLVFDAAAGASAMEPSLAKINPNYPRSTNVPAF